MSVATEVKHPKIQVVQDTHRKILAPAGNRASFSEETTETTKAKKQSTNAKPQRKPAMAMTTTRPAVARMPQNSLRKNASVDSSCSSDSTSSLSSVSTKSGGSRGREKPNNGMNPVKVVPVGVQISIPVVSSRPIKRCDWITPHSEPLYVSFHDEEWGVPVHDDQKLFELLVLSLALAEHTWISILSKRDIFRKLFDDFNPASIANFSEETLLSLSTQGKAPLSEPKIQEEFGSFNNYCWRFLNNRPIRNGFRYARQVPVKTPKAELICKDLLRRGFRCVGPTVIYSFMQVSGMVNDHLITCFRYEECNTNPRRGYQLQT
ncbi:hypothetical protein Ancab_028920 [Ancistrocladus abbreviatus]